MKKFFVLIICWISLFLFKVLNPLCSFKSYLFKRLYSYWSRNKLRDAPASLTFKYPVYIRGGHAVCVGEHTSFGRYSVITTWNDNDDVSLKIGESCNFGEFVHITAVNQIVIGDGVVTGRWVTITDNSHGASTLEDMEKHPFARPIVSKGKVHVGRNVWIGDKATILPGVSIGEGSIIGANSVVSNDIPAYSVAVGNPAKVVKMVVAK